MVAKSEALSSLGNLRVPPDARHGYIALFNRHEEGVATLLNDQVGEQARAPLAVATNIIFNPHRPTIVDGIIFNTAHYVAKRHPMSGKTYSSELLIPPRFGVSVSKTVLDHSQSNQADKLIENLRTISSPWVGMEAIARNILEQAGIRGLPPVIVAIASESDFNNSIRGGFSYGRWISVVEPGTRLGVLNNGNDLLFEIVWGSNVWQKGYANASSPQTFFTIQHEIAHLLTIIALRGESDGVHPENKNSITQVLGRPIWEGLADCIVGSLTFMGNDWLYSKMAIGYNPETSFFEQQTRSLGNATNYMNELFVSLLLTVWASGGNIGEGIDRSSIVKAAQAFIDSLSGRRDEVPEDAENGHLVKKIFVETNFDWQEVVNQIRSLTQDQVEAIFTALMPHALQEDLRDHLIQEYLQTAPNWDTFGEDSLR